VLTLPLLVTACATLGIGKADTATRILADLGCVTAATSAGLAIAGDPAVNGAKTALSIATAILAIGTSNVPATVLAACKDTLSYLAEDVAGAKALIAGSNGTTATTVPPPSTTPTARRPVPQQPKAPTPVVIPIPRS
jgi:hypothetical protein